LHTEKTKKHPQSPPKKKQHSNKTQNKRKRYTHLESPSSRMVCSSAVQSREMPGLCFMARAAPEVSGAEDDTCVCSWWFPDGFAIEDETITPFLQTPQVSTFPPMAYRNWQLIPANYRHTPNTIDPNKKGKKKKPKSKSKPEREKEVKAIVVRLKKGNGRER